MSESKTKKFKKDKEVKMKLIEKHLLDEKSDSFMDMRKAMVKAGYSASYAKSYAGQMWQDTNFTDILPKDAESPELFAQECFKVFWKLVKELNEAPKLTKVSAKYIVICDKILDKLMRIFGMEAPKREEKLSVNVTVPMMVCPECGHKYDIMKREYEGGEKDG